MSLGHCGFVSTEATFLREISHIKLSSEIVVALSEQNISQVLYFKKCLFRIEQVTMLFAAQEVLY